MLEMNSIDVVELCGEDDDSFPSLDGTYRMEYESHERDEERQTISFQHYPLQEMFLFLCQHMTAILESSGLPSVPKYCTEEYKGKLEDFILIVG